MAHCVNRSSPEFQVLSEQTSMNPIILAAKVSLWQEKNGLDNFPSATDISVSPQVYQQTEDMPASKASPETVALMKQAAEKMGIKMAEMQEYLKGNPNVNAGGMNGLADLTQKTIAIAEGREDVAITEEVVHVATAILEQTNPGMVTEMIKKIERFKIYKTTLEAYKGKKSYQLSNGKPDIRKIKKEAVDKLIAEVIVNFSQGNGEFPELTDENERNMIKTWWQNIMDYIRGIYAKSNIDVFQTAAKQITGSENIGTVKDIKTDGVFLQSGSNASVDSMYDAIKSHADELELRGQNTPDRHYLYQGVRVLKSVTEKVKELSKFKHKDRTPLQKIEDESKRTWGSRGHIFIEEYIKNNLIDKFGYKLDKPLNVAITTELTAKQITLLKNFSKELIDSYPVGTRFIVEKMVVDTKTKGMVASTVDFVAIEPHPETGFKIDTLDWKFTSVNKGTSEDISFFKQEEWQTQMGQYVRIWKNYGAKPEQIRKSRMVPFIAEYENVVARDPSKGKRMTNIQVGKLDGSGTTELYLLPVPLNSESTDNPEIDTLLNKLRVQYDKLYEKYVPEEDRHARDLLRDQLSRAIRSLHVQLNFEPLVNLGHDFLKHAGMNLKEFDDLDYDSLTQEQIQDKLAKLREYEAGSQKYLDIDSDFLSQFDRKNLDADGKKTLAQLEQIAFRARKMQIHLIKLKREAAVKLAYKENILSRDSKNSILTPEAPVTWVAKTMLEASKLPARIIAMSANVAMNANNAANFKVAKKINEFSKLLLPLEEQARKTGKKAFDYIGKVEDGNFHLIKRFDKKFWSDIEDAKTKGDKKYLMSVVDKDLYNKNVAEFLKKGIEAIDNSIVSSDPVQSAKIKSAKTARLKDAVDMNRKTFVGYEDKKFKYLLNKSIDEEKHFSKEYKDMRSNEAAFKMWEFFTDLNRRAKDMGYLGKEGMSFLPLIEASLLQKFSTGNFFEESKDFFKDLYTIKVNEQQAYAVVDPETGKPKQQIPKFFIKTDKAVNQLSTDLNKIGTLWIEALEKYEMRQNYEAMMHVLTDVEKAKGSVIMNPDGTVKFEPTGKLTVNEKENRNIEIQEAILNDFIYGMQEDLNSTGNMTLNQVTGKFVKDEEKKEERIGSIKKGMDTADTLVKTLAVGLKPLIGIANWAGYQFQQFIASGDMYTFGDFQKNNAKITAGINMSTKYKALLHFMLPLNEDVSAEKRREIANKQGKLEWLASFSFTDIMMLTNSFPERKLQFANAMSFLDNSMVEDGKIVNIRKTIREEDAKEKYAKDENGNYILSYQERRNIEKTYEDRVKKMKEEKSLIHSAEMNDDGDITIPGVSTEELAKFRTTIIEYGRNLSGQMNVDNKAGFRRDSMLNSFMMFKGWIPKQVHVRTMDLRKNTELDSWEYGRSRAFAKTVATLGLRNIDKLSDIIKGTDEGLRIMDEMLAEKQAEHYKRTGQYLEITNEEFYDLMRQMISNQFKELGMVFSMLALVFAAKAAEPPEDASELEKNRYKWWAKMTNKIAEEVTFYYDPTSAEAITRGTVIPALGLLAKSKKALTHLGMEAYGQGFDNEEMIKDAHPTKYLLNLTPGGYQFMTEVLPYISPDLYKELGGRLTVEARRQ